MSSRRWTPRAEEVYHYTVGTKLVSIYGANELRPKGFSLAFSSREKPVLWFSRNRVWEPTATKIVSQDGRTFFRPQLAELHDLVGMYRFRLDTAALLPIGIKLLNWPGLAFTAGISTLEVPRMVSSGVHQGAKPMDWCGTLWPVHMDHLALQRWTGDPAVPWIDITPDEALRIQLELTTRTRFLEDSSTALPSRLWSVTRTR